MTEHDTQQLKELAQPLIDAITALRAQIGPLKIGAHNLGENDELVQQVKRICHDLLEVVEGEDQGGCPLCTN